MLRPAAPARPAVALSLLAVGALALVGCGGGGGEASSSSADASESAPTGAGSGLTAEQEERVEALEDVHWPQPLVELLEPMLETYRAGHPWVADEELSPKSVARDLSERAMTFVEYVGFYGLARSEGLVLRYLADAYRALCEPRPHRPALPEDQAAAELERLAAGAWLDRDAVAAVLAAAGQHRRASRAAWPAGLSEREVEVLRLLARGQTNKQIAGQLFISAKTVQHHIAHIYAKVGISTRAGAALFASEHGIL